MTPISEWNLSSITPITSLGGALLTIAVMGFIAFVQRAKKTVTCRMTIDRLFSIEDHEGYEGKMRVLYDGVDIRNLNRVVVEILNSGNQPIRPDDFIEPIKLKLQDPGKILAATVTNQHPDGINARIVQTSDEITVTKLLLNAKDSFRIRAYVGDLEVEPQISGRIVGVSEITKRPHRAGTITVLTSVLAALLAAVGAIWTVLDPTSPAFFFTYTGLAVAALALVLNVKDRRKYQAMDA